MSKKDYTRQVDIYNPKSLQTSIKIIGVGSVGSFITLALAKMGLEDIEVWDGDDVQPHNLPNQFYRTSDLKLMKVSSLGNIIGEFTNVRVKEIDEPYNGQNLEGIVISAVDSLETRQFIWNEIKKQKKVKYYIDTRMGGELMRIYPINMKSKWNWVKNWKFYEKTLKEDGKLLELPCTGRTIIYNVLTIAGITANLVKKILKKEELPREIIFDLKTLTFITQ